MGLYVIIPLQVNQSVTSGVTIHQLPAKMRDGSQTEQIWQSMSLPAESAQEP